MNTMMKCGHAAHARVTQTGEPACIICASDPRSLEVDENAPDLTNRVAKCGSCDKTTPSKVTLPFFEYRGENSVRALEMCTCGYFMVAHYKPITGCRGFDPHGAYEYDQYYCGCRGWN